MSEPNQLNIDRFLIQSQSEIVRILRALIHHRALISATLDDRQATLVTALLLVEPERYLLALDYGPDPRTNERVLTAKKLFCMTKLDGVEVKFTVSEVKPASLQGQPVFCARLPDTLYYPQQRRFYRLTLPKASPLSCLLQLAEDRLLSLPVLDIGIGGLGLCYPDRSPPLTVGEACRDCRLSLPGLGELSFALEIRSLVEFAAGWRIGGAFLNLNPSGAALIQRYLNREQIKRRQMTPERLSSQPLGQ